MKTRAQKKLITGRKIVLYIVLCCGAIAFLLPFLWMVSSSLKPTEEVFKFPPQWIPGEFQWANYSKALTILPFHIFAKNSLIVSFGVILGTVVSCSMVAYGFAYFRFPLKTVLFIILLSTMMLPEQVTMIPLFKIFAWLGWMDSYKPLIVPAFCAPAFFVFLFRQFFLTLPIDLFNAAKIDGCSSFRTYWNIALPLSKPAVITVAIFSFMGSWNDFMRPLIYLSSEEKFTLGLGLASFTGQYYANWNLLMAASLVAVLPCIILFFLCQRYFVEGIATSGMKM